MDRLVVFGVAPSVVAVAATKSGFIALTGGKNWRVITFDSTLLLIGTADLPTVTPSAGCSVQDVYTDGTFVETADGAVAFYNLTRTYSRIGFFSSCPTITSSTLLALRFDDLKPRASATLIRSNAFQPQGVSTASGIALLARESNGLVGGWLGDDLTFTPATLPSLQSNEIPHLSWDGRSLWATWSLAMHVAAADLSAESLVPHVGDEVDPGVRPITVVGPRGHKVALYWRDNELHARAYDTQPRERIVRR